MHFRHQIAKCLSDLRAIPAQTWALASLSELSHALSALLWFCLIFLALFGASRSSLETNARRKRSATERPPSSLFRVLPMNLWGLEEITTAHVFGSMSSISGLSNTIPRCASRGINPNVFQEATGLTTILGHSISKSSFELLSIEGCTHIWRHKRYVRMLEKVRIGSRIAHTMPS